MIESLGPKEEQILHAAMQVFVEKGRHGARMQEIADRAGVNKAMLHYYFRSKDKLYATIFRMVLQRYARQFQFSIDASAGIETILRSFIDGFIEMLSHHPRLPMFIARELSEGGAIVSRVVGEMIDEGIFTVPRTMLHIIEERRDRGEIENVDDPVQFVITLLGGCVYFFIAEPLIGVILPMEETDRDVFIAARKEALFRHLCFGIKKRGDDS